MCALEKRSLTCKEKIWQADHAPGGFPTLHTHTISYTIFLSVHTYLKWSAKAPPIVYSQHTASSSSDCDSWSFFGFIQQVDAARYTMLIIYLSFVCFVCYFCDRFVCRFFPPLLIETSDWSFTWRDSSENGAQRVSKWLMVLKNFGDIKKLPKVTRSI